MMNETSQGDFNSSASDSEESDFYSWEQDDEKAPRFSLSFFILGVAIVAPFITFVCAAQDVLAGTNKSTGLVIIALTVPSFVLKVMSLCFRKISHAVQVFVASTFVVAGQFCAVFLSSLSGRFAGLCLVSVGTGIGEVSLLMQAAVMFHGLTLCCLIAGSGVGGVLGAVSYVVAVPLTRCISTTESCYKKTPHTVGVPAWAKAANRRKKSLVKMEKPKSEEQIKAEFYLANDPTELSIYTTTRHGPLPGYNEGDSQIERPKITLTADQSMFVCYHPARPFPLQFSKEVNTRQWWQKDPEHVIRYRDNLTEEEVHEVKELRKTDPKLWTVNALSHMLKVKPLAVLLAAPLTDEQKYEVEVERQVLRKWPEIKRKIYRANQELERHRYFEATRGKKPTKRRQLEKRS